MKKIILLVLILIAIGFLVTSKTSEKKAKNPNWEYVKNKLFDGKTATFKKLKGPILVDLRNASKTDSLLIAEIIDEIRDILPHKEVDFLESYTGKSYSQFFRNYSYDDVYNGYTFEDIIRSLIIFEFQKGKIQPSSDQEIIRTYDDYGITNRSYKTIRRNINRTHKAFIWLEADVFNTQLKKDILKGELFRSLCLVNDNNPEEKPSVFDKTSLTITTKITEKDIFLIRKLYEPDFLNQFENYLKSSYSWFYRISFLNKNLAETISIFTILLIAVIVFFLLFSLFKNKKCKFSFFNYFLPILFIWLYLFALSSLYYYLSSYIENLSKSYNGYWFVYIRFLTAASITSITLFTLEKLFLRKQVLFTFDLIAKVIFTFIAFCTPRIIETLISSNTFIGNYFFSLEFYLFLSIAIGRGLLIYLNHFSASLVKEKNIELSRLKEVNAQAETKLLQAQINPHFLYNSLNSIASLAPIDAAKTQKMAHSLSDLFKYSINRKNENFATIKDEIEMIKTYLEIEKIRFGEDLQFTIHVDESLENYKIPLFLIQPLVENAVKHGISKNVEEGKIDINIENRNNNILISVNDNGPNFPEGLISGHGLQTVYDLLRLNYKNKASLNFTNEPQKTITISIPKTV
ncbi:hypothetical protein FDT66_08740 [Polaribacter aestuariivivens]|uniref:Uncharacterized protein n=1 Tax=Polaribacter aestuariivivens TaxID=2304626 RepID=A0A5S3N3P9_9FLAO|nr:histidine kinase [Polaribacter aestuariivivens]TMM29945.1 hypothetical protein FDT66_08740 [Polaribacter aestuariivivens]